MLMTTWSGRIRKTSGCCLCQKIPIFINEVLPSFFLLKVICFRRGNCTTSEIAILLQTHQSDLLVFAGDTEAPFLEFG